MDLKNLTALIEHNRFTVHYCTVQIFFTLDEGFGVVALEGINKNTKIFEMDRLSGALIRAPLYRSRLIVVN